MPRCPACRTPTDLVKYEGVPVYNCGSCGGYWLSELKLEAILARREVVMPPAVQEKFLELAAAANRTERLWCWTCGCEMDKTGFKYWPEIQLDVCPRCHGIWLDRGELEKCQIYWEYLQDHPDSPEARRIERLAELETRWQQRRAELEEQVERSTDPLQRAGLDPVSFLWELFSPG